MIELWGDLSLCSLIRIYTVHFFICWVISDQRANSADPDQMAHMCRLIWIYTVCPRNKDIYKLWRKGLVKYFIWNRIIDEKVKLNNNNQGFFSPFWEYDLYPWNWEISRRFARNWDFFASLGNKKFYTYLIFINNFWIKETNVAWLTNKL